MVTILNNRGLTLSGWRILMVDPKFVTNYNRSDRDLEEFAIFSVCVAGKNAHNTARAVDKMLSIMKECYQELDIDPMDCIYQYVFDTGLKGLQGLMKECGIGCYTRCASTCYELAQKSVDNYNFLRRCKVEDLENIKGIGAKTARFFILHSRPAQRIAALDTHILQYLRDLGIDAPNSTPPKGSKKYKQLEETFLKICDETNTGYADMDLLIWNAYSLDGLKNPGRVSRKRRTNATDTAKDSTESKRGLD